MLSIKTETIKQELTAIMNVIRDDVICFMEYPYVEKVYRDSYYSFFSKKHNPCHRDSLRISFFINDKNRPINADNYFTIADLEDYFLGYISLRPTTYRIIGSSFLHPLIMKDHDFVCCLCRKTVLINGLKLAVHGFPYCSQDNESITCSEVSILNIMEYFGHKYPEYSTILPSQIAKMLSKQIYERQLPSKGIMMPHISYVLKKLGFGVIVHSCENENNNTNIYQDNDFRESLFIYIESGIPVILLSENHAILAIGRKETFDNHKKSLFKRIKNITSFTDFVSHLLVMNDNRPPYELMDYDIQESNKFNINFFIVPLYSKVNMNAYGLKKSFNATLRVLHEEAKHVQFVRDNKNCVYRYFFTSSKSYKDYIAKSQDLLYNFKILALNKSMPKFIGVVEIINKTNFEKKNKMDEIVIEGLVVLDATESGVYNYLIFATNLEYLIIKSTRVRNYQLIEFKEKLIFHMFKNNLKGEHTQWKG
ncbi:MAG: hypothetical protein LBD76_06720 [Prevotellaceae bacterium]|jgi:hypothetical protein|nr:hypothetical protein [Prevotellaceae bacterium]